MRALFAAGTFLALAACGSPSTTSAPAAPGADLSAAWQLDAEQSHLAFVSVKGGELAESHTFTDITGAVGPEGAASLTIGLDSVETNVDIRNERMREMLFETAKFANAQISADVPMETFSSLEVGERSRQLVPITVSLHGLEAEYDADMYVTRVSGTDVLVETASPVLTTAYDFGLDGGVEMLRNVAGLESISFAVPVTVSLMFSQS
ncbi:MAG: YceI family protein [Pseudomonadota bacterium]